MMLLLLQLLLVTADVRWAICAPSEQGDGAENTRITPAILAATTPRPYSESSPVDAQLMDHGTQHALQGLPQSYTSVRTFLEELDYGAVPEYDYEEFTIQTQDYFCGQKKFCNKNTSQVLLTACFVDCLKCSCEDDCFLYNTCCLDKYVKATETEQNAWHKYQRHMNCFPKSFKPNINAGYEFMITTCPSPGPDSGAVHACLNASTSKDNLTPVLSKSSSISYRNRFCALCNGIDEIDIIPWPIQFRCEDPDALKGIRTSADFWTRVMSHPLCAVWADLPAGYKGHTCFQDVITSCNVTGYWKYQVKDDLARACDELGYMPLSPYFSSISLAWNKTYKNIFCALCNGVQWGQVECSYPIEKGSIFASSLLTLLDFRTNEENSGQSLVVEQCKSDEIYNPLTDSCLAVFCPQGSVRNGPNCEHIVSSTTEVSLILHHTFKLNDSKNLGTILAGTRRLYDPAFYVYLFNTDFYIKSSIITVYCTSDVVNVREMRNVMIEMYIEVILIQHFQITDIEDRITKIFDSNLRSHCGRTNHFLEVIPMAPNQQSCEKYAGGDWTYSNVQVSSNFSQIHRYERQNFYLINFESPLRDRPEFLMFYDLNCSYIKFNISQSELVMHDMNSLTFQGNVIEMNETDFKVCHDIIKICEDVIKNIPLRRTVTDDIPFTVEGILSLACTIPSLLCLLATLFYYYRHGQLQTIPGKNMFGLVLTLFMAQLLYKFGLPVTHMPALCIALGIFIQYLWLTVFFWMNVCAFHMFRVFINPFDTHALASTCCGRFKFYLIYALVSPIIIVALCIIVNVSTTGGAELGYGKTSCYISEPFYVGLFFALPVGLIVIMNTGFFLRTLKEIHRISRNQSDSSYAVIAVRLSVGLGLTWIFGYLSIYTGSSILSYIFIILNGGHGVFIFLLCMYNVRSSERLSTHGNNLEENRSRKLTQYATTDTKLSPTLERPKMNDYSSN